MIDFGDFDDDKMKMIFAGTVVVASKYIRMKMLLLVDYYLYTMISMI